MNTIQNSENDTHHSTDLRFAKIPLNFGSGAIPALGFGTLIPDPAETKSATTNALRAGFRHFDCAERYRNEREVGESLRAEFATGAIAREDVFITTKLWNTNHRPERVEPAFDASCQRLGINYVDLYLIHTPFAFQPGDNFDPRDQNGNIIYDDGVTLLETWRAMESSPRRTNAGPLACPMSLSKNWSLSMKLQGSNRPWFRSNRIRICLKRSCWSSVSRKASSYWRLRHWATECDLVPWKIRQFWPLPNRPLGLPPKSCSPGRSNVERPSLPPRKLRSEFTRTTISLRFPKTQLTRSTEFKPEAGSTRWSRPGFPVSLQEAADIQAT
jgi:Aldo/keto reductase family